LRSFGARADIPRTGKNHSLVVESCCENQKALRIKEHEMQTWQQLDAVERSPDIVSGALVFRSTRVPVAALFENLRDGASIDDFLAWFPGVTRAQVEAVLDHEAQALYEPAQP
jgi:uncharacterized protein (DUF433 family)